EQVPGREQSPFGYAADHLGIPLPRVSIDADGYYAMPPGGAGGEGARSAPGAPASRPGRSRPLVWWRDREGEAETLRCHPAPCARSADAGADAARAGGCAGAGERLWQQLN